MRIKKLYFNYLYIVYHVLFLGKGVLFIGSPTKITIKFKYGDLNKEYTFYCP